ncbi:hypothetical protein BDF19DRAFT_431582 [Syncephalis fuscata]|nr:hypothetical protein BDF19DRAFT_431582 [Syncephalis fuscata]
MIVEIEPAAELCNVQQRCREYLDGIRRVAVIGAGVNGLLVTRYIKQECGQLDSLRVFEQRNEIGGTWIYSEYTGPRPDIPSKPMSIEEAARSPSVESPIYINLHTNLPLSIMALHNRPFPASLPEFPQFPPVLQYWQDFADDYQLRQHISFNTQVTLVERTDDNKEWRALLKKQESNMPFTPTIPGLALLYEKWPNRVKHVFEYRRPEAYEDKDVMVVGNGPSAVDIARDLRPYVKRLVRSIRGQPITDELRAITGAVLIPEIKRIYVGPVTNITEQNSLNEFQLQQQLELNKPTDQQVWIELDDGKIIPAPDNILFATGYRYALPFLPWLFEDKENSDWPPVLAANSLYCKNLYKQIYYTELPTLMFPGLQKQVSVITIMERQAWHIAAVLSGQCGLPSRAERALAWQEEFELSQKNGKNVHIYAGDREWQYMDWLVNDVLQDPRYSTMINTGVEKSHPTKISDQWKEIREHVREQRRIKLGF